MRCTQVRRHDIAGEHVFLRLRTTYHRDSIPGDKQGRRPRHRIEIAHRHLLVGADVEKREPGLSGMPNFNMKGSSATPSIKDRFKKRKK